MRKGRAVQGFDEERRIIDMEITEKERAFFG